MLAFQLVREVVAAELDYLRLHGGEVGQLEVGVFVGVEELGKERARRGVDFQSVLYLAVLALSTAVISTHCSDR